MTWKFRQIKPQKARGKFLHSMWTDSAWIAETKYDGDRRIAQFCSDRVRFTGTRESVDGTGYVEKSVNLPHLMACTIPQLSLEGTVLDGEIVHPNPGKGGGSKFVTAIMGSSPAEAIRKQKESGWLEYRVFDCLWFKGHDVRSLPLYTRRSYVDQALKTWGNKYASMVEYSAARRSFYEEIVKAGGEGVVLKHIAHSYGNEKLWVKVKHEATADVVVLGFKPGKNKNAGMVGSIEFGQHRAMSLAPGATNYVGPAPMGYARGFSNAVMRELTKHPRYYVGTVFRIKHNGREPTGAFRHPRFDCWRPDKSAKDCVYDPQET